MTLSVDQQQGFIIGWLLNMMHEMLESGESEKAVKNVINKLLGVTLDAFELPLIDGTMNDYLEMDDKLNKFGDKMLLGS